MTQLFKNIKYFNVLKTSVRYKNPAHHWSVLRKKKNSCQKALDHFDDFYKSIYGQSWKNIRLALLSEEHKYVAVVNNFSDTERICEELTSLGALNLKDIYDASKKNLEHLRKLNKSEYESKAVHEMKEPIDSVIAERTIDNSLYPSNYDVPVADPKVSENQDQNQSFKPVKLESIETGVNTPTESSRLIKSSTGLTASQLHEFIPATELKGMDDFVLESDHYAYYSKGADFSIKIEEEMDLHFPDNLLLYVFEEGDLSAFPRSNRGSTEVSDYFVLDGASIFPVLSLNLQPGDTLLDMCAAPGGKALTALQSLVLRLIVANDIQESRTNRINHFLNEFVPSEGDWQKRFIITQSDARHIQDNGLYNKILVDVPCTTDRHVLHSDENNIFKGTRVQERLRLPEIQSDILTNALKLVIPGGTVVYSTCTLSPIQNDGVVQMALKRAFEEFNHRFIVKDQTEALLPLRYLYNFGDFGLKYGHIVIPSKNKNWGPIYFCKMVRVQ